MLINHEFDGKMINIDVPEIPDKIKNKTFGSQDIKWIKSVNDSYTSNAYMLTKSLRTEKYDGRVITIAGDLVFCLQAHLPSHQETLNKADPGDLIVLYQKLEEDEEKNKCFTHLVTPIRKGLVDCPYSNKGWNGIWVKIIAITDNQVKNSIFAKTDEWRNMPIKNTGSLKNLNYNNSSIYKIDNSENLKGKLVSVEELSALQNYIWKKFEKYLRN